MERADEKGRALGMEEGAERKARRAFQRRLGGRSHSWGSRGAQLTGDNSGYFPIDVGAPAVEGDQVLVYVGGQDL